MSEQSWQAPLPVPRRKFVAWLIATGFIPTIGLSIWRQFARTPSPTPGLTTGARRIRHPGVVHTFQTKLAEGLFVNPRSNICHYVDATGLIKGVTFVKSDRLRPADPLRLSGILGDSRAKSTERLRDAPPSPAHVNFARSSHAFEQLALGHVRANPGRACDVLLTGIRQDILRLHRRMARPSFRLYDLLALVAIRKNQQEHLRELRDVIAAQPQEFQAMFATRVARWQNPSKRLTDPQRKWAGLLI